MPELLKCFPISNYFAWLGVFAKLLSLENVIRDHAGELQTPILLPFSRHLSGVFGREPWHVSCAHRGGGKGLAGGICWAGGRCQTSYEGITLCRLALWASTGWMTSVHESTAAQPDGLALSLQTSC